MFSEKFLGRREEELGANKNDITFIAFLIFFFTVLFLWNFKAGYHQRISESEVQDVVCELYKNQENWLVISNVSWRLF